MKKIKQIFPSRNYITIDTTGDIEIIFNPVGNGFEGDDKLQFRRGRWAFRCNDFLAGKMLPNGENENMNRKIYSLNLVYDTENGEPIVNTTYVDPTSVIPLDGSLVSGNWLTVPDIANLATVAKQNEIKNAIDTIDFSALSTVAKQNEINVSINNFKSFIEELSSYLCVGSKYNLTLGQVPHAKRVRGNVFVEFSDVALVFFGADCSVKSYDGGDFNFYVHNCEKVLVRRGGEIFEYFNNLFTQIEFFHFLHDSTDFIVECQIAGTDSNNVFNQNIYTFVNQSLISASIFCY